MEKLCDQVDDYHKGSVKLLLSEARIEVMHLKNEFPGYSIRTGDYVKRNRFRFSITRYISYYWHEIKCFFHVAETKPGDKTTIIADKEASIAK